MRVEKPKYIKNKTMDICEKCEWKISVAPDGTKWCSDGCENNGKK